MLYIAIGLFLAYWPLKWLVRLLMRSPWRADWREYTTEDEGEGHGKKVDWDRWNKSR